jgi:hypothetical protein
VFEAVRMHRREPATVIAGALTDLSDYVNILLLRGEQEYEAFAPADRSFEAFGLARRLQIQSNQDQKKTLSRTLREAEETGDAQLVRSLLRKYQELLDEEV